MIWAMSTARLEAFSDGVIAIAITLLVLNMKVPAPGGGGLGHALAEQWPVYAAYVVSFLTIGVIWINHHASIGRLASTDHTMLVLNLLLLMAIGALPFTTSLMASYLRESSGEHLAAAIYAGSFLVLGCLFFLVNRYALRTRPELLREGIGPEARTALVRRNAAGLVPYFAAVAIAPLSSYATLAICAAVAVYYAWPGPSGPSGSA
ncbi:MAG: hypothetical protein JWM71_262 [Solirubrobacteraceae bacterium]|nr:hypothetical protein [Solirubrobacteraceae bacterium]